MLDEFGDARRTEIQEISKDFNAEDLIPNHPMVVTVSGAGYINEPPSTPTERSAEEVVVRPA